MAELVLVQPGMGKWDMLRSDPTIPLGLLHASSLAAREFDIRIVDQRLEVNWKKSLAECIGPETLAVCFTAYIGAMIFSDLRISEYVRGITDVPIVWGGVHPTLDSESTLAHPLVDIIVRGEGEYTFLELARALREKRSLDGIKGVWFKKNGEIVRNPDRDLIDLNELPDIPYHLIDIKRYLPLYAGRKSVHFQSSRGCPNACIYCYNTPFNKNKYRTLSAGRVLERLRNLVDTHGVEDVQFVDDNFFVDLKRDREIVEGLKSMDVTWQLTGVDVHAIKRIDDEFLELLKESGLVRVSLGIESGSPRVRQLIGKKIDPVDIETQVKRLMELDLLVCLNFMVGLPTETSDEVKETVQLLLKLLEISPKLHTPPIFNCQPLPGTALWDLALENGFDPPKTLEEWGPVEIAVPSKLNGRDKAFYESLFFVSYFLDRKAHIYDANAVVKYLSDIYRPIARYRIKHLNFKFLIEKSIAELILVPVNKYVKWRAGKNN